MSRYLLLFLCVTLWALNSCGTAPANDPKPIPRRGPHRPIFPPRAPKKVCTGKPTVIAVIDTGFGFKYSQFQQDPDVRLCKFGHRDFSGTSMMTTQFDTKDPVPMDPYGHGTNIAGIIDAFAKKGDINYCIVVLNYYNVRSTGNENVEATIKAIKYATAIHADFINYSGGGILTRDEEKDAVKAFIDQGGTFVAAAGNEGTDLALHPYYPAMDDDRVIVAGMGEDNEHHDLLSNFGARVNRWEPGRNIKACDITMSGTSQATAVATGKLVYQTHNFCK